MTLPELCVIAIQWSQIFQTFWSFKFLGFRAVIVIIILLSQHCQRLYCLLISFRKQQIIKHKIIKICDKNSNNYILILCAKIALTYRNSIGLWCIWCRRKSRGHCTPLRFRPTAGRSWLRPETTNENTTHRPHSMLSTWETRLCTWSHWSLAESSANRADNHETLCCVVAAPISRLSAKEQMIPARETVIDADWLSAAHVTTVRLNRNTDTHVLGAHTIAPIWITNEFSIEFYWSFGCLRILQMISNGNRHQNYLVVPIDYFNKRVKP